MQQKRYELRLILVLPLVLLISACAFSPGFRSGTPLDEALGQKPILINEQNSQESDFEESTFYSKSGVRVFAVNLNKDNLPIVPENDSGNEHLHSLLSYQPGSTYKLAPGDVVSFFLWGYPEITPPNSRTNELSAGVTINEHGDIYLPLIGSIPAAGQSLTQLQQYVRMRYAKFLKSPDVSMKLLRHNSRRYYVSGQVRTPGEFVITEQPASVMTAISQAGGGTASADMNNIILSRGHRNYRINLSEMRKSGLSPTNIYLRNKDVIKVGNINSRKVYLLGEAQQPEAYILPESGWTLSQVLGEGRGINPNSANPSKIYVLRDNKAQNTMMIYRVDLSQIENFALASRFNLVSNDIVFVDSTGLAKWNRVVNLLLPSSSVIRSTRSITN